MSLPPFDLARLFTGSVSVVIGRRGTGKSALVKSIVDHTSCKKVLLFTHPAVAIDALPEHCTRHSGYDSHALRKATKEQEDLMEKFGPGNSHTLLVVFDGLTNMNQVFQRDIAMQNVLLTASKLNVTVVLTQPYCPGFLKMINLDFCFLLRESNVCQLYEWFGRMFYSDRDTFEDDYLDTVSERFRALVLGYSDNEESPTEIFEYSIRDPTQVE